VSNIGDHREGTSNGVEIVRHMALGAWKISVPRVRAQDKSTTTDKSTNKSAGQKEPNTFWARTWESKIDIMAAAFAPRLQLPGGDGGEFHVAKGCFHTATGRKLKASGFTTGHLSGRLPSCSSCSSC
jgi:hypothetical protein